MAPTCIAVKPLSPRAQELVSALRRAPSLTERLLGGPSSHVRILAELEGFAEPALVPHLLDSVFGDLRSIARAAAIVLDRAVASASPDELLELDRVCRGWWPELPATTGWRTARPLDLSRFSALGDSEVAVVGVASFHGDGYVREAAVTRLSALGGGRELSFLLVRLNDWVAPVAERAQVAVERRLTPTYAAAFLDSLPILLRLELSRRRGHRSVLDQVYALLRAPEQRDVLARGLEAPQRTIRRTAFRLARESSYADRPGLLRQALRDSDTLIRLEAAADTRRHLPSDAMRSVLPAVVADPYPSVRAEGIAAAAERLGDEADGWLMAALLDANKSVREVARFFLRRSRPATDFAAHYRGQLHDRKSPRHLAIALAGLGETGDARDAALVLAFLGHERPAVRRTALRALASLDPAVPTTRILEALHDPAPSVSHAARQVLRQRARQVPPAALAEVFRTAAQSHSRLDALAVDASLGKWDRLPMLLEAAADADGRICAAAASWLAAWVANQNQSFAQPTRAQLDAIRTALDAYRFALEPSVATELSSVLHYWTGSPARDASR